MNTTSSQWLTYLGLLAIPVVGVVAFGHILPLRSPASAKAATLAEPDTRRFSPHTPETNPLTPAISDELSLPFAGSPMLAFAGPTLDPGITLPESLEPDADPISIPSPDFNVSALMNARTGNIAIINSKVHAVGDVLGDGWSINAIDPSQGSVTLIHLSGATATLRLQKPNR